MVLIWKTPVVSLEMPYRLPPTEVIDLFLSMGYHLPGKETPSVQYGLPMCPFKDLLKRESPTRD